MSDDAREQLEAAVWREVSRAREPAAWLQAVDNILSAVDNYAAAAAAGRARVPAEPPGQPTTTQVWQAAQRRAVLAYELGRAER
jgi:hypothetical protein